MLCRDSVEDLNKQECSWNNLNVFLEYISTRYTYVIFNNMVMSMSTTTSSQVHAHVGSACADVGNNSQKN